MIKQSDIEGRLNLFRYGIVVVTITALLISFAAPMVITADMGEASLGIGDLLVPALIITAITAVIGIGAYFVYAQVLNNSAGSGETASQ